MAKSFSCNIQGCNRIFERASQLKKHKVEHTNPKKVIRCPKCDFTTLYPGNYKNHENTHSDRKPFVCPDMTRVIHHSGSSSQPIVSEIPCTYRSNHDSALSKHRIKFHGYVPDPKRSLALARRAMKGSSQAAPRTTASINEPVTVSANKIVSSSNQASHSTPAHPSVGSVPPPVGQSSDGNHHSVRTIQNPRYAEAWNQIFKLCAISLNSANARSSVPSQNNGATTPLPLPILPNNPASLLRQNSNVPARAFSAPTCNTTFFACPPAGTSVTALTHSASASSYTSYSLNSAGLVAPPLPPAELPPNNRAAPSPDTQRCNNRAFAQELAKAVAAQHNRGPTTQTVPILPNTPSTEPRRESDSEPSYVAGNDATYASPELSHATVARIPEADATDSSSSAMELVNDGSLPHASLSSPAPTAPSFDNNDHTELDNPASGASNNTEHTPVVEPIQPSAPVGSWNILPNGISCPPSPPPVRPEPPETGPGLLDFEMALYEGDIFFRGTGREGCLCPELMVDMDAEGCDRSHLDY